MEVGLAESLGVVLGTGAASFVASWLTIARPLRKEIHQASQVSPGSDPKIALLEQRVEAIASGAERGRQDLADRLTKAEERVGKCVTDEEFAAYAGNTTKAVQGLTEKVGHVTGALEAWYRQPRERA